MTNEEAIKVLRTESIELGGSVPSVCRFWEALDMAVKALEDVTDKNVGKMTNADRIRAMSDEELAKFLFQVGYNHRWGLKEYALEWLQQPAEDDENGV